MKTIEATELKKGDIFCHELKLYNREAFIVDEVTDKSIICRSRTSGKTIKKQRIGKVVFLRAE